MAKLYNLARMTSATTGPGTLTLGSAVSGYLTFAQSGVQDGDIVTYGIKDGANSELGYGKYTASGTSLTRNPITSTNSNSAIGCSGSEEVYVTAGKADFPFPDNYLTGLALSNDGVSPNTVVDIAAGVAADTTNVELMRLTSAITKTTGSWAVGSGNGGLDAGSVAAGTWYHVHLIRRPDTGGVDVLISTSASAPTMPANYTQKRRIGSLKTDGSSHIVAFLQREDSFFWSTPVAEASNLSVTSTPANLTLAGVPSGVRVRPILNVFAGNASVSTARVRFYSPDLPDNNDVRNMQVGASAAPGPSSIIGWAPVGDDYTNTSAQIRYANAANDAGVVVYVFGNGYVDLRGRLG